MGTPLPGISTTAVKSAFGLDLGDSKASQCINEQPSIHDKGFKIALYADPPGNQAGGHILKTRLQP